MPPHVEVDSHQDDDHFGLQLKARKQPLVLSTDQPSPLFLDYESVNPQLSPTACTTCSLSRRQSDPNFAALVVKDEQTKKVVKEATAPIVSVITAIIGPESAYVRNASNPADRAGGSGASTPTTTTASTAKSAVTASNDKQQPKNTAAQPTTTTSTKPSSANTNTTKGKQGRQQNRKTNITTSCNTIREQKGMEGGKIPPEAGGIVCGECGQGCRSS